MADKLGVLTAISGFTEGLMNGMMQREKLEQEREFKLAQLEQQEKRDKLSADRFEEQKRQFSEDMAFKRQKAAADALRKSKENQENHLKDLDTQMKSASVNITTASEKLKGISKAKQELEDRMKYAQTNNDETTFKRLEGEWNTLDSAMNDIQQVMDTNKVSLDAVTARKMKYDAEFSGIATSNKKQAQAMQIIERIESSISKKQAREALELANEAGVTNDPEAATMLKNAYKTFMQNDKQMKLNQEYMRQQNMVEVIKQDEQPGLSLSELFSLPDISPSEGEEFLSDKASKVPTIPGITGYDVTSGKKAPTNDRKRSTRKLKNKSDLK